MERLRNSTPGDAESPWDALRNFREQPQEVASKASIESVPDLSDFAAVGWDTPLDDSAMPEVGSPEWLDMMDACVVPASETLQSGTELEKLLSGSDLTDADIDESESWARFFAEDGNEEPGDLESLDMSDSIEERVSDYAREREMAIRAIKTSPEIYAPTKISAKMAEILEKMTPEESARLRAEYDKCIVLGDDAALDFLTSALGMPQKPKVEHLLAQGGSHSKACGDFKDLSLPISVSDHINSNGVKKTLVFDSDAEYQKKMDEFRRMDPEGYDDTVRNHIEILAHETWHFYQHTVVEQLRKGQATDPEAEDYMINLMSYFDIDDCEPIYRSQKLEAEAYWMGHMMRQRIWGRDDTPVSHQLFEGWRPYDDMIKTTPEEYRERLKDEAKMADESDVYGYNGEDEEWLDLYYPDDEAA